MNDIKVAEPSMWEQAAKAEIVAPLVYDAHHGEGAWTDSVGRVDLSAERGKARAAARMAVRVQSLDAQTVALDRACAAIALARGYEWPSLRGFVPHPDLTHDPELARLREISHIRRDALAATAAYRRHLEERDRTVDDEGIEAAQIRQRVDRQMAERRERRAAVLTVVEGGKR